MANGAGPETTGDHLLEHLVNTRLAGSVATPWPVAQHALNTHHEIAAALSGLAVAALDLALRRR
jgi:hypothetical protein